MSLWKFTIGILALVGYFACGTLTAKLLWRKHTTPSDESLAVTVAYWPISLGVWLVIKAFDAASLVARRYRGVR